jgi:hypothetical protein
MANQFPLNHIRLRWIHRISRILLGFLTGRMLRIPTKVAVRMIPDGVCGLDRRVRAASTTHAAARAACSCSRRSSSRATVGAVATSPSTGHGGLIFVVTIAERCRLRRGSSRTFTRAGRSRHHRQPSHRFLSSGGARKHLVFLSDGHS